MNTPPVLLSIVAVVLALPAAIAQGQQPAAKLAEIQRVADAGPFESRWASLANYQVPEW